MSKISQANAAKTPEASDFQVLEDDVPTDALVCTIQLLVSASYNGYSYDAGAKLVAVPVEVAQKMATYRTAKIIGEPAPRSSRRYRNLDAIENITPGGYDPEQWQPAHPTPGQRSSSFVKIAELEEIQNRR